MSKPKAHVPGHLIDCSCWDCREARDSVWNYDYDNPPQTPKEKPVRDSWYD